MADDPKATRGRRDADRSPRGRRLGRAALPFLAAALVALAALQVAIEREVTSEIEVRGPDGRAGIALMLYHPGLSGLQEQLTDAYADGLVEAGWRVERTTTSAAAPVDLTGYDLLVLGVHTYWWAPDGPTRRYLGRVEDLDGLPVVALVSALGAAGRALRVTEVRIEAAGGTPQAVLPFYVLRPNDETDPRPNDQVALEAAYRAGLAAAR
jgi:hypothetical protein